MLNLIRLIFIVIMLLDQAYANKDHMVCENYNEVCEFIHDFKGEINQIINLTDKKEDIKYKLQKLISSVVDISYISRFVMGIHWNTASERQRNDFSNEYYKYITYLYMNYLKKYSKYEFDILSIKKLREDIYYASIRLIDEEDDFFTIEFKLLRRKDFFYIQDLKINSAISIIVYQRDKINRMITEEGIESTIFNLSREVQPE